MTRARSRWSLTVNRLAEVAGLNVKGIGSQRVRAEIDHDNESAIWCWPAKVGVGVVLSTRITATTCADDKVALLTD
jgi:hypothetical protein